MLLTSPWANCKEEPSLGRRGREPPALETAALRASSRRPGRRRARVTGRLRCRQTAERRCARPASSECVAARLLRVCTLDAARWCAASRSSVNRRRRRVSSSSRLDLEMRDMTHRPQTKPTTRLVSMAMMSRSIEVVLTRASVSSSSVGAYRRPTSSPASSTLRPARDAVRDRHPRCPPSRERGRGRAVERCGGGSNGMRYLQTGGGGGIRTHERLAPLPVFKTGAMNRSATPPRRSSVASR